MEGQDSIPDWEERHESPKARTKRPEAYMVYAGACVERDLCKKTIKYQM
jgi:hypothetical protein